MTDPDTTAGTDLDTPLELADEGALDDLVTAHDVVLVAFFTTGCSICESMEPVVGAVARATDAVVAEVNPRDDPVLIDRFDVRSVPLFVLFVDGEPVARRADGFVGTDELRGFVETGAE